MATKIAIVDDDQVQLERLKLIFSSESDFSVVGTFGNGREAMASLEKLKPEIILTDIKMPEVDGLQLIRAVCDKFPEMHVVALTICSNQETIIQAIESGAYGYLVKSESASKLVSSVRDIVNGQRPFSAAALNALVNSIQPAGKLQIKFTGREMEILEKIHEGLSYKEIASQLGTSVHTVHNQVKTIFSKLDATNKMEAIRIARKKGLIS